MTRNEKIEALAQLKNIGVKSAGWMVEVGVDSAQKLAEVGAVETFLRMKRLYPRNVTTCALWALQGAIENVPYQRLDPEQKDILKERAKQAMEAAV